MRAAQDRERRVAKALDVTRELHEQQQERARRPEERASREKQKRAAAGDKDACAPGEATGKEAKKEKEPRDWKSRPTKLRQKDRDARWTVKFSKAKTKEDGSKPPCDIAIPVFGYQNHVSIDRGFGFIRKWAATDAAAYEGTRLREGLLDKTNAASSVWADTAYRSAANEKFIEFIEKNGFVSRVHRKKPKRKPMPDAVRRANAEKSKVRSYVEHVFAEQKDRMALFIRTIGLARAKVRIGMANLVYDFKRLVFLRRTAAA